MTSVRLLTVELRFSDASPKDVARTLAPPEFESDLEDFFTECFVWAGTLVLGLPRDYTGTDGVKWPFGAAETAREQWLTERLREYDGIRRVVYDSFYDTPMKGYFSIYRRSDGDDFVEIDSFDYGQGAPYFDIPRDYGRESVDYIQSKYGLHVLSYREVAYPNSRTWDFDVERIC